MNQHFDIIGDVHGQAEALREILGHLGWAQDGKSYAHPEGRKLISVGDVINKGPDPLGALEIVADLVAANRAAMILGNHELNALHYLHGLRPKTPGTTRQFSKTMAQIAADPKRWEQAEVFLRQLPFQLELAEGALQIVHAAWPEPGHRALPADLSRDEDLRATGTGGDLEQETLHCVKGPEQPTEPYKDRDGILRETDRVTWWQDRPPEAPMIVFGHYCFPWPQRPETPEQPQLLGRGANAACLDFGAGRYDRLVALRWPELEFVTLPIR